MKFALAYIIVPLLGILISEAAPALPAIKTVKSLQCKSGQVCAMVCGKDGNVQYSLYEFVHYNSLDGFYMRLIQEDTSQSRDAQIQAVADKLSRVDSVVGEEFTKDVKILTSGQGFKLALRKKEVPLPADGKCVPEIMVVAKHKKFVVDAKIYNQLSSTDQAGFISRLALIMMGMTKSLGLEYLVPIEKLNRHLFWTERDDKIVAKARHRNPLTALDIQSDIQRQVARIFFPAPTDQNVAALTGIKPAVTSVGTSNPSARSVFNNIPPSPPAPVINNSQQAANIVPGSDIVPQNIPAGAPNLNGNFNGYETPALVGITPEMVNPPMNGTNVATNGVPVTEGAGNIPPAGTGLENDPNTNNSAPSLSGPEGLAVQR